MPKTARYLLVSALALLVLAVLVRWGTERANEASDIKLADWGRGDLKVSEEAYYGGRISAIVDAWMKMGQRAAHDPDGRLRDPYHTFLVIDAARGEIWIEDAGHILEEYHSELPRQMPWTLYHDDGKGVQPLGKVVRLKYRGVDPARQYPERVWLAGQRPKEFLAVHFTCSEQGRSRLRGPSFRAYHSAPGRNEGIDYYAPILVSDAEYERSRLAEVEPDAGKLSHVEAQRGAVDENRAAWLRVQKRLYQAMEAQVLRAGFHLRQLRVVPGPDYSAAHAEMDVTKDSLFRDILGGLVSTDPYLMIDYLGDDVWYAKLVPNPERPVLRPDEVNLLKQLPLEFLVAADQAVPSSARRAWIEKGRAQQRRSAEPRAEWTATLPNGAVVTLLGVCESPSEGKQWWGPDGSPIDFAPRFTHELTMRGLGNRKAFEIVWRVQRPAGNEQSMSVEHFFEDGFPFDSRESCDRYGVVLRDAQHYSYSFEKTQEKATLRVGADLGGQGVHQVRFKNISLVPGTNQGFEIEVVK
jgi:hypothetical protein